MPAALILWACSTASAGSTGLKGMVSADATGVVRGISVCHGSDGESGIRLCSTYVTSCADAAKASIRWWHWHRCCLRKEAVVHGHMCAWMQLCTACSASGLAFPRAARTMGSSCACSFLALAFQQTNKPLFQAREHTKSAMIFALNDSTFIMQYMSNRLHDHDW